MTPEPSAPAERSVEALREVADHLSSRLTLDPTPDELVAACDLLLELAARAERGERLLTDMEWLQMALGWAVFRDDSRVWASNELRDIQARIAAALATPPEPQAAREQERS